MYTRFGGVCEGAGCEGLGEGWLGGGYIKGEPVFSGLGGEMASGAGVLELGERVWSWLIEGKREKQTDR